MSHGIDPIDIEAIVRTLRKQPRVERAIVFGSRALGTFRPASDIDICLVGSDITLADQAEIAGALDESTIPQEVDLVLEHTINNAALLEHIRYDGKTIYERRAFSESIEHGA